jgi:hypothetical protein
MFRSERMTLVLRWCHGVRHGRHERHGHDASMTGHDGSAVMAEVVGNQREAELHDTMTLNSSKWRDKGKSASVKHREHGVKAKPAGRRDFAKSSVMPSWRVGT